MSTGNFSNIFKTFFFVVFILITRTPKHHKDDVAARTSQFYMGAAGLAGTAEDYLRFCQMLLNGGVLDGKRPVSRKTIELMTNHIGRRLRSARLPLFQPAGRVLVPQTRNKRLIRQPLYERPLLDCFQIPAGDADVQAAVLAQSRLGVLRVTMDLAFAARRGCPFAALHGLSQLLLEGQRIFVVRHQSNGGRGGGDPGSARPRSGSRGGKAAEGRGDRGGAVGDRGHQLTVTDTTPTPAQTLHRHCTDTAP